MSVELRIALGLVIFAVLCWIVVGALWCLVKYFKRRADALAYKDGYESGVQLLFAFDVAEIKIFADALNDGKVPDAYNRGLYQALADNE